MEQASTKHVMTLSDKKHSSKKFDEQFNEQLNKGLQYYPWVGKNYDRSKERILIVGESHYADGNKKSVDAHKDSLLTRRVIEEIGIADDSYMEKLSASNSETSDKVLLSCIRNL